VFFGVEIILVKSGGNDRLPVVIMGLSRLKGLEHKLWAHPKGFFNGGVGGDLDIGEPPLVSGLPGPRRHRQDALKLTHHLRELFAPDQVPLNELLNLEFQLLYIRAV